MTIGIDGTGPYGRIRNLRTLVSDCKYELRLISEGIKRTRGKRNLEEALDRYRLEIRSILKKTKKKS